MNRVKQISLDILVNESVDGEKLAKEIENKLENNNYIVLGSMFNEDITEAYENIKEYTELLKENCKLTNEQKAIIYCEKYGILPYKITDKEIIYYANYPKYLNEKRRSYKIIVDLKTLKEKRILLKRYTRLGNNNLYK